MTLHDFIISMNISIGTSGYNEIQMILPIGTSGYNISEYISKLQIHQHSLLTRKVFFRHNFQHWPSSLYRLDHLVICISGLLSLQVIFIFKSSSSSSHLHLQVIGSGSSLDLDHHYSSSLDLNHHWISIITRSGSSLLDHHQWISIIT